MKIAPAVFLALFVGTAAAGEATTPPAPPKFKAGPAAKKDGDEVKITFELDRETDVAVYVLDAKGKVVRHLAAGLLGDKAPKPLKAGSLKQSVTWDGKDDAGKKAAGGPFKVRVAAGLGFKYAGCAFGSEAKPDSLTNVVGLAAGPDGRVYVLSERWGRIWWRHTSIHVFRRDGSYEKTVKPFPSSIAAEKVRKLTPFATPDGRPIPVIYRVLAMSYYPHEDLRQQMAVGPDGNLHFLTQRAAYRKDAVKRLASIGPDGGVAYEAYVGGELPAETSAAKPCLAASPDGKAVFAVGLERGPGERSHSRPNRPAVWKIELPGRKEAKLFFGDRKETGKDETHLNEPRGLAADGKGHLLVADRGNNRVVSVDIKSGKFVSAFEVPAPTWVGVHRKTGAVYVASGGHVIKFAVGEDGKAAEKGRVKLPALSERYRSRAQWFFALDDSRETAVLWVGVSGGGHVLTRCEEKDGKFTDLDRAGYRPARTFWNICVAPDRRTVGCKAGRRGLRILDEDTGKTRDVRLTDSGGQMYRLGPNGQIYGMDHSGGGVRRWDKNGKYLPFPASSGNPKLRGRLSSRPSGTTAWERDFDVDRGGNIYAKNRGKVYHGRMTVEKFDKDGKRLGTLVWVVSDGAHGPRVDPAGNIYVVDSIRPVGVQVPEFFRGKLPEVKINKRGSPLQQYRWMYGSVIKFSPKGGAIWFPIINKKNDVYAFDGEAKLPEGLEKVKVDTGQGDRVAVAPGELQGALWYRYGCSYVLDMHPGHNRRCHCTATEFEVDDFGRSFYTDQGRFRVVVLDTGGNQVAAFGQYGNQDACAGESYVLDPEGKFLRPRRKDDPPNLASPGAKPEIAFNWFTGLGVSDRYVYVADGGNRRVLRAQMTYAADRTVGVE
jgi:hypothetical protein